MKRFDACSPRGQRRAIAAGAALGLAMPVGAASALCMLALVATLQAALERRHAAMAVAAGIATGLAPQGAALAPLVVGLAIRRRCTSVLLLALMSGGATWLALGWPQHMDGLGLWSLAAALPDGGIAARALLTALGPGIAAWCVADCSARPLHGDDLLRAALTSSSGFVLLAPLSIATLLLPAALAWVLGAKALLRPRAVNDNALPPRIRPA